MKALKYNIAFLGLLLLCLNAQGQERTLKLEVGYKAALPLGNFQNLVDKTSLNGWEAAVMYNLTDQAALGFQVGFQDFYQKYDRQVYHGAGSDISAVITNSVQIIPLMVKGKYRFTPSGVVQPFVGLGIGGNLVQYSKYYGQFADAGSGFSFAAQPEVGVHIPVSRARGIGINIAAAYNYVPFQKLDADGLHHATIKAGVSIPMRQ